MARKRQSKLQRCAARKIPKITREERAKPAGQRRTRNQILGKAFGICRREVRKRIGR